MPQKLGHLNRGFTLVEVLVAATIALLTLMAINSLYLTSQKGFVAGSTFLEIHSGARLAMDYMVKDIRWARQLEINKTIGAQTYTTGTGEIILKIPSIDSNGDIIKDSSGDITTFDYIVYHLDSTTLERIIDADVASSRVDGTRIIAHNVGPLIFSWSGTELSDVTNIAIELTTSKKIAPGRTPKQTINSIVELRNKE